MNDLVPSNDGGFHYWRQGVLDNQVLRKHGQLNETALEAEKRDQDEDEGKDFQMS